MATPITSTTFSASGKNLSNALIFPKIKNKTLDTQNTKIIKDIGIKVDNSITKSGSSFIQKKTITNPFGSSLQTISSSLANMSAVVIPTIKQTVSDNKKSYNDSQGGTNPARDPNSIIFSNFTVTDEGNRCLIVCITAPGSATSPTYTCNWNINGKSYPFTSFIQNTENRTSIWYLVNPISGTGNVTIGVSPTNYWEASCSFLVGVDQNTPLELGLSSYGTAASNSVVTTTLNFTGNKNNLVINVIKWWANPSRDPTPSGSTLFFQSSDGAHKGTAQYKYTAGGADSFSWTWPSGSVTVEWYSVIAQVRGYEKQATNYSPAPNVYKNSAFYIKNIVKYVIGQMSSVAPQKMFETSYNVQGKRSKISITDVGFNAIFIKNTIQSVSLYPVVVQSGIKNILKKSTSLGTMQSINKIDRNNSIFSYKAKILQLYTVVPKLGNKLLDTNISNNALFYANRLFRRIAFWT